MFRMPSSDCNSREALPLKPMGFPCSGAIHVPITREHVKEVVQSSVTLLGDIASS